MKKILFWLGLIALVTTACKPEPDPGDPNGHETNDTTEAVVKKYLVKEYYANAPDQAIRVIHWNNDFSKITHITTQQNTYFQLDYNFEYFGSDSMCVIVSKPEHSSNLGLFTGYTCHLNEQGKIIKIDYYHNSEYQQSYKYSYESSGKLVSIKDEEHNSGYRFVWDGDNVCEIRGVSTGELISSFSDFSEHIHPDYTTPNMLPDVDGYGFWYLTTPLWRNWYGHSSSLLIHDFLYHEFDEDGYVTCSYYLDEDGERTAIINYEYKL